MLHRAAPLCRVNDAPDSMIAPEPYHHVSFAKLRQRIGTNLGESELEQPDAINCAACGAENSGEMSFCGKCGSKLLQRENCEVTKAGGGPPQKCWKCGSMMPPAAMFCGVCGYKLGPADSGGTAPSNEGDTANSAMPEGRSDKKEGISAVSGVSDSFSSGGVSRETQEEEAKNEPMAESRRPEGSIREMVVIPEGQYPIGSDGDECNQDERPRHLVELSSFYIDRFAVSNAEYEQFDPNHSSLRAFPDSRDDEPVVFVTYADCEAYCRWRCKQEGVSEGTYRLPTEAQWEVAARGGALDQTYPWGDEIVPSLCNTREARRGRALPVGEGVPNGYGILHLGDNIREWCLDWYVPNYYEYLDASGRNPSGPSGSAFGNRLRVVRGASYQDSAIQLGRCAARNYSHPKSSSNDTGLRCVRLLSF